MELGHGTFPFLFCTHLGDLGRGRGEVRRPLLEYRIRQPSRHLRACSAGNAIRVRRSAGLIHFPRMIRAVAS